MKLPVSILLFVVLIAGCSPLPPDARQFISEAAAELSRVKHESEQWAHRVKGDFKKGSTQYETAYSKYIPAKAAVSAWLDRLGIELTAKNDIASSEDYQAALRKASTSAENFLAYARGLYDKSLTPSASFVNLLPSFADIGLKIWNNYRAASKEAIDDVKKSLQTLQWKSFDEA